MPLTAFRAKNTKMPQKDKNRQGPMGYFLLVKKQFTGHFWHYFCHLVNMFANFGKMPQKVKRNVF